MYNGYLTNAAMLLFSKDPESWQIGAYIKIGYFETDADLRYQDEVHGPLLEQADRAIEVLHLKYMKAMISYDGLQRVERYFVPKEALREALLNAICHKDYSSGIPIQVSVYKDKLYIANCGHLPENLTVEKLMSKHSSEPYNPHIAHVFYLAGMIESWGRGIEKICEACQTEKSNLPVYTINDRELMVKFSAMGNEWSSDSNDTINKDLLGSLPSKLPSNIEIIYKAICDDPHASNQELAVRTNQSERTIRNHTAKLKEMNFIKRIGSDKTGHWEIVDKGE